MTYFEQFNRIRALACSARWVLVAGARASVESDLAFLDLQGGSRRISVASAGAALLWIGDDRFLAGLDDGTILVVSPSKIEATIAAHSAAVTALSIAVDRVTIASSAADGTVRLWRLSATDSVPLEPVKTFALSGQPLRAVAFDANGEHLGVGGDDGIVRSVTLATGAVREMPGHDGPVYAVTFSPLDGRIVSGGDDGSVRLWFISGDIEAEVKAGDHAHTGAVRALVMGPVFEGAPGDDPSVRLFSAGDDGLIKVWRLGDRRRPRTIEPGVGPLRALALMGAQTHGGAGAIVGGERRKIARLGIDAEGALTDRVASFDDGFAWLESRLSGGKTAERQEVLKTLASMEETEARALIERAVSSDAEAEVRGAAVQHLLKHARRESRPVLRVALDDNAASVRNAAFDALLGLDADGSLAPLTAALKARASDMRARALRHLVSMSPRSPLARGWIEAKLVDPDATVRLAALDSLAALHPVNDPAPLKEAFERGLVDVKVEVLSRAAFAGQIEHPVIAPIVVRAMDDADADVRRTAFVVAVLARRALVSVYRATDGELDRWAREVVRRVATARWRLVHVLREHTGDHEREQPVPDAALDAAIREIPSTGDEHATPTEDDLAPLLAAMACRAPDSAVRGARGLALVRDLRALGALLQLSREQDAEIRRQSALALEPLHDARARKRLVWLLEDPVAIVREAAFAALRNLEGGDTLALADAALRSGHEDVRMRALASMVAGGGEHPSVDARSLLGDALDDEASKVRAEAFRTLWAWHTSDPEPAISRALRGRFADIRARAVTEAEPLAKQPWARGFIAQTIADRDASVAQAAYDALVRIDGKEDPRAHLAAIQSTFANVRLSGARGARHAAAAEVRGALEKLLEDKDSTVRTEAVDVLDRLYPVETAPLLLALRGSFVDVRVRAAELLAGRRDDVMFEPMRSLLLDTELIQKFGPIAHGWRQRASVAIATLGSSKVIPFCVSDLLRDADPSVREQGARALSTATRKGDEPALINALGHDDLAVRSWAAEGLARLGDAHALPVLIGTLRHDHPPIRIGAILSFAALGPEGYGGLLQGLEDPSHEVQQIVFAVVLARDLRALRKGEAPDLLSSALSSQRPEVRFAAARSLELRVEPEGYLAYLVEALLPARPEKASDMKEWPDEQSRARLMVGLAEVIAGEDPERRYAASQALRLRDRPLDFFREVQRIVRPRAASSPVIPETTPRARDEAATVALLRRVFAEGVDVVAPSVSAVAANDEDKRRLRWLAFGAYVGMLRQTPTGDEEASKVRRDAIDRVVELAIAGHVTVSAAVPPVARALDDPSHLVRRAAFAALKRLFSDHVDEALSLALSSSSADVARSALDELAALGAASWSRIKSALDASSSEVRRYAFELLEKLAPPGSPDPLFAAIESSYSDIRIGVLERLSTLADERVVPALCKAMESEHADLRLRAAELLANRKDERAVVVLGSLLSSDEPVIRSRAIQALVALRSASSVEVMSTALSEAPAVDRFALIEALGKTELAEALTPVLSKVADDDGSARAAIVPAVLSILGPVRDKRDVALCVRAFGALAHVKDRDLREAAARELADVPGADADALLVGLITDRDAVIRGVAVSGYAKRVIEKGAPVAPLEDIVRAGSRALLLPAAEAVASRQNSLALRPLLLLSRAGEPHERPRALLSLGVLGDVRAVDELLTVAAGGTEEAPADSSMEAAAVEALGWMLPRLKDAEVIKRLSDHLDRVLVEGKEHLKIAAVKAFRRVGGERARLRIEGVLADQGAGYSLVDEAARQLGELGDLAAEGALGRALDQAQGRLAAREALLKLFPKDRTRVELIAVASRYADVAGPAVDFLVKEGDPIELVRRLSTMSDVMLRARLRRGLIRRGELPVDAVISLLGSSRDDAIADACTLIATLGAKVSKTDLATIGEALFATHVRLETRCSSANTRDRVSCASSWRSVLWAARVSGATRLVGAARALLDDQPAAVPELVLVEAISMLAGAGDNGDLARLRRWLSDGSRSLRRAASSATAALSGKVGTLSTSPYDAVAVEVAIGDVSIAELASREVRHAALPRLIRNADVKQLAALARSPDKAAQAEAIGALGLCATKDAQDVLAAVSKDKSIDKSLQKAAYLALRKSQRLSEKNSRRDSSARVNP